jgi:hypothetical protein
MLWCLVRRRRIVHERRPAPVFPFAGARHRFASAQVSAISHQDATMRRRTDA